MVLLSPARSADLHDNRPVDRVNFITNHPGQGIRDARVSDRFDLHSALAPFTESVAMRHYDCAVIGTGPAGQKAAIQAAKLGKRVCIIEKNSSLGGAAINTGT